MTVPRSSLVTESTAEVISAFATIRSGDTAAGFAVLHGPRPP